MQKTVRPEKSMRKLQALLQNGPNNRDQSSKSKQKGKEIPSPPPTEERKERLVPGKLNTPNGPSVRRG